MIGANDDLTQTTAPAFPKLVEITIGTMEGDSPFNVDLVDNRGGRIGIVGADTLEDATRLAWETRAKFRITEPVRHASETVNPEAQAEFERLMLHAYLTGEMLADQVLTGNPPPWEEAWFQRFYGNAVEQAGNAYKIKWPELTETIVVNMQVRFCFGLENRIKDVLGGGSYIVPNSGGAN